MLLLVLYFRPEQLATTLHPLSRRGRRRTLLVVNPLSTHHKCPSTDYVRFHTGKHVLTVIHTIYTVVAWFQLQSLDFSVVDNVVIVFAKDISVTVASFL